MISGNQRGQIETGPALVRRVELAAADIDSARDQLQRLYGARISTAAVATNGQVLALSELRAPQFRIGELRLRPALDFRVRGRSELVVAALAEGEVSIDEGRRAEHHRAGQLFLGNWPGARFRSRSQEVRALVVSIRLQLIGELTGVEPDLVSGLRFESRRPINPAAGARWLSTARHVQAMLADTDSPTNPLFVEAAGRLLAASTLAAFPSNAPTDVAATQRHDSHPAVLRRAIAYVESYADTDITLADVANASSVSVRSIQLAFRRHLGTTPMGYLRTVRLAHAHDDLTAAEPDTGETVASIAARWGFTNAGRFAALYRATYGVSPSRTLQS